jgi:hypothetical protein
MTLNPAEGRAETAPLCGSERFQIRPFVEVSKWWALEARENLRSLRDNYQTRRSEKVTADLECRIAAVDQLFL